MNLDASKVCFFFFLSTFSMEAIFQHDVHKGFHEEDTGVGDRLHFNLKPESFVK